MRRTYASAPDPWRHRGVDADKCTRTFWPVLRTHVLYRATERYMRCDNIVSQWLYHNGRTRHSNRPQWRRSGARTPVHRHVHLCYCSSQYTLSAADRPAWPLFAGETGRIWCCGVPTRFPRISDIIEYFLWLSGRFLAACGGRSGCGVTVAGV
jgi:hypothetical protein